MIPDRPYKPRCYQCWDAPAKNGSAFCTQRCAASYGDAMASLSATGVDPAFGSGPALWCWRKRSWDSSYVEDNVHRCRACRGVVDPDHISLAAWLER